MYVFLRVPTNIRCPFRSKIVLTVFIIYVGYLLVYVGAEATTCACGNAHCVSMAPRYAHTPDVKRCIAEKPMT